MLQFHLNAGFSNTRPLLLHEIQVRQHFFVPWQNHLSFWRLYDLTIHTFCLLAPLCVGSLLARLYLERDFAAILDFTFSDKPSLGKLPMGSVRDMYTIITQLHIELYLIWMPGLFASAKCGERDMYLIAKKAPIRESVVSK